MHSCMQKYMRACRHTCMHTTCICKWQCSRLCPQHSRLHTQIHYQTRIRTWYTHIHTHLLHNHILDTPHGPQHISSNNTRIFVCRPASLSQRVLLHTIIYKITQAVCLWAISVSWTCRAQHLPCHHDSSFTSSTGLPSHTLDENVSIYVYVYTYIYPCLSIWMYVYMYIICMYICI